MTERSVSEITSEEDVSYEIKRARIETSPTVQGTNKDCDKVYSNGNNATVESGCCDTVSCCDDVTPRDMTSSHHLSSEECKSECNGGSNGVNSPPPSSSIPPPTLPIVNPVVWVHEQIENGINPMSVLINILPPNVALPEGLSDLTLWRIVIEILSDMPKRTKLPHINTLHDVISLLKSCRNIVVVSGAGISVSCGIPDFRSKDGVYARLAVDYPDLPNPQAMFDIQYFSLNPKPFFKFASEIWPGQFSPSPSHHFIKQMEERKCLLRNYTQNIDTLERVCGIRNVIQCHGSFSTASCRACGNKVDSDTIKDDIMKQVIPVCKRCPEPSPQSIMKPDIVFFGEGLPNEFHHSIEADRLKADLVIVMGSSLKVKPVAHIPNLVPPDIPQILINREPLPHLNFDVELLGDCDIIVSELCSRLEWNIPNPPITSTEEKMEGTERFICTPPARYIFPGAEVHDDCSQVDSASEEGSESQSGVTTEDEESNTDNYVAQMRYVMGCDARTYSENPGPSRISQEACASECAGERWDCESVSNVSVAAQMGDSREPSVDNVSICSEVEDMESNVSNTPQPELQPELQQSDNMS